MLLYFIPGRGETFDGVLGRLIRTMGCRLEGREVDSRFARAWFSEQLALVRSDVYSRFWNSDATLIGRSYGAYLLLHVLADLQPYPGKVLLCSPVLGPATFNHGCYVSRPPRAEKLLRLAERDRFPAPRYMEIHTGENDTGSDSRLAVRFASLVNNAHAQIVAGAGHDLPEDYLRRVLRTFLQMSLREGGGTGEQRLQPAGLRPRPSQSD
jgi:hypothetical protein